MTLKEYLEDYASEDTKAKGEALIENELTHIPNEKVLKIAKENLVKIADGSRDFRF
jgi:2-iminoacetate synthase